MRRIRPATASLIICAALLSSSNARPGTGADSVSSSSANADSEITAFESVSVIPMDADRVLSNQTVLTRDGRITAIGPAGTLSIPPQTRRIDGRRSFLMPGLVDMHVHLMDGDEMADEFPMFLAYGITTIRQMSGAPSVLAMRRKVSAGEVWGPKMFTVGVLIDGSPPVFHGGSVVVTTPEQARETVNQQKQAGYDEVKVYDNLLLPQYDAVVAEAARVGIPVVGHVPKDVSVEHALQAHQASIEHLMGYLTYVQRADSPFVFRHRALDPEAGTAHSVGHADKDLLEMTQWVDPARITEIAKLTAAAGTWNVPTLVQLANAKRKEEYTQAWKRPGMQYATKSMRDWWNSDADSSDPAARARLLSVRLSLVRALHQAHAKLLAGTDTPHPFVLPGLSLHDELHNFIAAGLTPYEALWSATRGPAEFLGAPKEFGVVASGARADLVLLEANPLTDIDNALRIVGVMVRGRWLSKDRLQQNLEDLASKKPSAVAPQ
jgi:imidazolonepropionase-like amidohydrolase